MLLAYDGTAHQSLERQICIIGTMAVGNPAAPTGHSFRPTSFPAWDADQSIPVTPQRGDALRGMETYGYDNWDCEGAKAITQSVIGWTKIILDLLPQTVPNPDLAPAASGSVCMEWSRGDDLVWADVEPNGHLLMLTKFSGKKSESVFKIGNEKIRHHLATAFARLYPA
jgi:hypothetical protein